MSLLAAVFAAFVLGFALAAILQGLRDAQD